VVRGVGARRGSRAAADDPGLGETPKTIGEHVRSRATEEGLEIRVTLRAIEQGIDDMKSPAIPHILEGHREGTKAVIRTAGHRR
jgi:hypothetical protein